MSDKIKILAIESSCDETAAAVVEDGRCVKSNIISSQIELHKLYGGVVPEIASRKHVEKVNFVVREALKEADVKQMWLTHYSPSLVRAEEFMGKVKSIFPKAKAGKDGKTITLDFQEE